MSRLFVVVANDLGQHRRSPVNPAGRIKRRAGGWFRWAHRDTLKDALVTRSGLGIGYRTLVCVRARAEGPIA